MPFSGFLKPKPSGGRKPMIGKQIITPGSTNTPINFGFHDGTGYSAGVVVPVAKVLSTETIAGQTGTMPNNPAENLGILGKTLLNLIANGNFASGTTGWVASSATISAASNILSVTATAQYGNASQIVATPTAADKIYISAKIYGATTARIYFAYDASGSGIAIISPTQANVWQTISAIGVYPSSGTTLGKLICDNTATSGWTTTQLQNAVVINLTKVFGAGLEPTQAQMDAIMTALGGWFDGNTVLSKIASGGYINNGVLGTPEVLLNDPNLIGANILSSKSIFGVAGTIVNGAGMKNFATGTATASANLLTVSGLSFAPKVIAVYAGSQEMLYNDRAKAISGVTSVAKYYSSAWSAGGDPTLTSNGFTISTPTNVSYTWEATD